MRKLIIGAVAALALVGVPAAAGAATAAPVATCARTFTSDSLYVGDANDNSVQRFDAATGCHQGALVGPSPAASATTKPDTGALYGPRGILHLPDGNFLVSNQNVGLNFNGEIDQYSPDGRFLGALVPAEFRNGTTNPDSPFDPDGIILGPDKTTLYVADLGEGAPAVGQILTYNVNTGYFLGALNFSSFIDDHGINPHGQFQPRGLVFGPDGLLYVSVGSMAYPEAGWILSYNTSTGVVGVVASNMGDSNAPDCSAELHRPDGLTFGPDGQLYVTSFQKTEIDPVPNSTDIDQILIYDTATGACTGEIALDQVGQLREYAQYILFGPGGYLFVPILAGTMSDNATGDAGAVLQYDVSTKTFTNFIAPSTDGGPLGSAWGLTFGQTNPTTLAYGSS